MQHDYGKERGFIDPEQGYPELGPSPTRFKETRFAATVYGPTVVAHVVKGPKAGDETGCDSQMNVDENMSPFKAGDETGCDSQMNVDENMSPFKAGDETGCDSQMNVDENMSPFGIKSVRRGFIFKVYSVLSIQLIITLSLVLLFTLDNNSKEWAARNSWLLIFTFTGSFSSLIALACCGNLRRQFPMNFICLGIFTLAQAFTLGIITAFYRTQIVWLALVMTLTVCIGLTVFPMQTKIHFTVYSGIMFVVFIILSVMGSITLTFNIPILTIIYAGFGALIFCVYLIIDTQMIIGGGRKEQISPEEYILGTITLYTDIISIFMSLKIMNSCSAYN